MKCLKCNLQINKSDNAHYGLHPVCFTDWFNTRETNEPSMQDYVKELKRLGYLNDIQDFYQRIKLSQLYQLIAKSFCSDLMKEAIKKLLMKRFAEFKNELKN